MNVNVLQQYKCHKVIRAGKISEIDIITKPDLTGDGRPEPVQGAFLSFDNYPPVTVTADFVSRHQPQVGGYLVAYEDGYLSYSPAAAFEAGYHPLPLLGDACDQSPALLSHAGVPAEYPSYAEEIAHQRGHQHGVKSCKEALDAANVKWEVKK